jgi:predicted transcriptional regulator
MPFEICILTMKVENLLIEEGTLKLDYVVEVKGAQAERTRFTMDISEQKPLINPMKEYDE